MHFKRIELNGFKSFADPVTIEFTDGITCVVGPNGSGKSNISDAVLWVLGEQSPKSLRSDKLEEVIFSGTQSRKAKGMAEVTLVIDNSDHQLPIEYSEVGITRRAYRSGENEYMINRRPCRLKDIRELIMDTGIGVEGYSIVGQGKIADIVSSKMERRREIFEEAAGIVKYRSKKEKTEKKLAEASVNLSRVNDIVKEIEGRIGKLEEDSRKATEYLEIKDKYRDVEVNIILKNIEAAEEKSGAVNQEIAELDASENSAREKKDALDAEIRELRSTAAEQEELLSGLQAGLNAVTERIHDITTRDELNAERISSLNKEQERLTLELAALSEKENTEAAAAAENEAVRKDAEEKAAEIKKELSEKRRAFEAAEAELADAMKRQSENSAESFRLRGKIQEAEASVRSTGSLCETLEKRRERLEEESALKDRSDRELKEKLAASENEIQKLKEEKNKEEAARKLATENKKSAAADINRAAAEAGEIKVSMGRLAARKALIEELERSYEGYSGAVKFLMSQGIEGVAGTLGELLEVPKGYELAVEAVLGGKLQNIVCRDDSVAKKCIELLKKSRAGRLTFLPVEDLKVQPPLSCRDIEGFRGFIGLASDMVGCGPYGNVAEYMLGNVVFVDNLENAIAISRKNKGPHKLVSLEGELINPAGAITGGSLKNNTGNILSRRAEKDELSEKTEKLKKELEKTEAKKKLAEEALAGLEAEIRRADEAIKNAELGRAVLERDLALVRQSFTDAENAEKRRLEELEELREELKAAADRQEALSGDIKSFERMLEASKEEAALLLDATEEKRETLAKASADETSARLAENAASLTAQNAEGLCEISRQKLREISEEKAAKQQALESAALAVSQIESFAKGASELLDSARTEKKELESRAEEASAKKKEASARAETLEEDKRLADSSLYDLQSKLHDARLRQARFEAQSDSFKEKLWDEFELSFAQAAAYEDPEFVMSKALKESKEFRDRIRALGPVNLGAIEEYKQVKERYDFLTEQKNDILSAMEELRSVITQTDAVIKSRFKESFNLITSNFEEVFKELFKGGHASLTMSDPGDPLESAIEIEAQPPGKRLQNISLLSGGERTLTALALMFAVLRSKPTPFCILDEVEAALDEANIETFAKYVHKFESTQFVLVTHQKLTMEYSDALYGVTMPEQGISKVLSLRLGDEFEV